MGARRAAHTRGGRWRVPGRWSRRGSVRAAGGRCRLRGVVGDVGEEEGCHESLGVVGVARTVKGGGRVLPSMASEDCCTTRVPAASKYLNRINPFQTIVNKTGAHSGWINLKIITIAAEPCQKR